MHELTRVVLVFLIGIVNAELSVRTKIANRFFTYYDKKTAFSEISKPEKAFIDHMDLQYTVMNGYTEQPEECDDGNDNEADGCHASIGRLSVGFVAKQKQTNLSYEFYAPKCGDGYTVSEFEMCDDGNNNNNDGCSSQCRIEFGYHCFPMYIDAIKKDPEVMARRAKLNSYRKRNSSDNNKGSGTSAIHLFTHSDYMGPSVCQKCNLVSPKDCSLVCYDHFVNIDQVCISCYEADATQCGLISECPLSRWEYLVNSTVGGKIGCNPICGDGYINGREECDSQSNYCLPDCTIDPTYDCLYTGTTAFETNFFPLSTDEQYLHSSEKKENTIYNDEYSSIRTTELGIRNIQVVCAKCGDGVSELKLKACDIEGAKEVRRAVNNDGSTVEYTVVCNKYCEWMADVSLSAAVCGNGRLEAAEECDDGNKATKDGCSDICTVEQGYVCTTPSLLKSFCTVNVGSGIKITDINYPPSDPNCINHTDPEDCIISFPACEDGNLVNYDGCDVYGRVESGWIYQVGDNRDRSGIIKNHTLVPASDDGVKVGHEECDCNILLGTCEDENYIIGCNALFNFYEDKKYFQPKTGRYNILVTEEEGEEEDVLKENETDKKGIIRQGYSCVWRLAKEHSMCTPINGGKLSPAADFACNKFKYVDITDSQYGYSECNKCNSRIITKEQCLKDCYKSGHFWDLIERMCTPCDIAKTELDCLNCSASMLYQKLEHENRVNNIVEAEDVIQTRIKNFKYPYGFWWSTKYSSCFSCSQMENVPVTEGTVVEVESYTDEETGLIKTRIVTDIQFEDRFNSCFKSDATCPGYYFPAQDIFYEENPSPGTKFFFNCSVCPLGYACRSTVTTVKTLNGLIYEAPKPCLLANKEYSDSSGTSNCKTILPGEYCSKTLYSPDGLLCIKAESCIGTQQFFSGECGACEKETCVSCAESSVQFDQPEELNYIKSSRTSMSEKETTDWKLYPETIINIDSNIKHNLLQPSTPTFNSSTISNPSKTLLDNEVTCLSCNSHPSGRILSRCAPDGAVGCEVDYTSLNGTQIPKLTNVSCNMEVPVQQDALLGRENMCISSYHRILDQRNAFAANYIEQNRRCENCLTDTIVLEAAKCMSAEDLAHCVSSNVDLYNTKIKCKAGRCNKGYASYSEPSMSPQKIEFDDSDAVCSEFQGNTSYIREPFRFFQRLYPTIADTPGIPDVSNNFIYKCDPIKKTMLVYNRQAYDYHYASFADPSDVKKDTQMIRMEVPIEYHDCERGRMTCYEFFMNNNEDLGDKYRSGACCQMFGDTNAIAKDFYVSYISQNERMFLELETLYTYFCECTPPYEPIDGSCRLTCPKVLTNRSSNTTKIAPTSKYNCDNCGLTNPFICLTCGLGQSDLINKCDQDCLPTIEKCIIAECIGNNATIPSCVQCDPNYFLSYTSVADSLGTRKKSLDGTFEAGSTTIYSAASCVECLPKTNCINTVITISDCTGEGIYDANSCNTCKDGTYGNNASLLPIADLFSPTCQFKCHPTCKKCTSGSDIYDCIECADSAFLYPIDFVCYTQCPNATFPSINTYTKERCVALSEMDLDVEGESGSNNNNTNVDEELDIDAAWWISDTERNKLINCCIPCPVHCIQCTSRETCTYCEAGYSIDTATQLCALITPPSGVITTKLIVTLSSSIGASFVTAVVLATTIYLRFNYLYWLKVVKEENLVYPTGGISSYALASDSYFNMKGVHDVIFLESEEQARIRLQLPHNA